MTHVPTTYIVPEELSSPKFGHAFAQGCGGPVTTMTELLPGDVALFGSPQRWPLIQAAMNDPSRQLFYGDHGYLQRGQYFRVTKNAYQATAHPRTGAARFNRLHLSIAPWQRKGRHILICPNSAIYCGLFGFNVDQWIVSLTQTLRQYTEREIRVRWKDKRHPIEPALCEAHAVITYSSMAALDALLAGVPVFVLAPFAAAYRMGTPDLSQIETPVYPEDRESFFHSLASQQWTLRELASGVAWRDLQRLANHEAIKEQRV